MESKFEALTPRNNVDLRQYKDALDFAFSRDDIRNIALSGSYGSGKSSIIETYERSVSCKDKRFIHISLARFDDQKHKYVTTNESEDSWKAVNRLEGKILNQLIHQIKPRAIPQSEFKIKRERSRCSLIIQALLVVVFALLLLYVIKFSSWVTFVNSLEQNNVLSNFLLATSFSPYRLVAAAICALIGGIVVYRVLRNHNLQNFLKKIEVKGVVGVELFGTRDASYFDKYLDEVLYLFRHAKADAIVFEDLDRYNVTLIFEKLREINDLIYRNGYRKRHGLKDRIGKPLRFLYLIRDDVFTSADRSKFFDFIIPVVPVIDATNSCNILNNRFDHLGITNQFNKHFLQDVSLYLSDMRMVTNIVNEYLVYDEKLDIEQKGSKTKLVRDPNRQLAMIIYKNLYPGDFDLLHQGRGYVYCLLGSGKSLADSRKDKIEREINEIQQQMKAAQEEMLASIDELNAIFFPLNEHILAVDGKNVEDASRIEVVKAVLLAKNSVTYLRQGSSFPQNFPLEDIRKRENEMKASTEYQQRSKVLERKSEKAGKQLSDSLAAQKRALWTLSNLKIQELLEEIHEDDEFWNCKLPSYEQEDYVAKIQNSAGFDLLKYLIRNGYLDETYSSYISYFYPGGLTTNDKNFLLSVNNRTPLDYNYPLDASEEVLDRLQVSSFNRPEIYNYSLFCYLLHHSNKPHFEVWLDSIGSGEIENAFEFPLEFWRADIDKEAFIKVISVKRPSWFFKWYDEGYFADGEWRAYALDIFYFLDAHELDNELGKINENNWLTKAISEDSNFIKIDNPCLAKIEYAFRILGVQFYALSFRKEDRELLDVVYRDNCYALTAQMIETFLKEYLGFTGGVKEGKSYTYIRKKPEEPLYSRVQNNLNEYMTAILADEDNSFWDDEKSVIELLNSPAITGENKSAYAERLKTTLTWIKQVEDTSLWPILLEKGCVKYTWENIVDYYANICDESGVLSKELVTFICSDTKRVKWGYEALNDRIGKDIATHFRAAIIKNRDIPIELYRTLLSEMRVIYNTFTIDGVPSERISILFELGMIAMNIENVEAIRKSYPSSFTKFVISSNQENFAHLVETEEISLDSDELETLLGEPRLNIAIGIRLIDKLKVTLTLKGKSYPAPIKAHIIKFYFDDSDISSLLFSFEQEDIQVQSAFSEYTKDNFANVADVAEEIGKIPLRIYADCLEIMGPTYAENLRRYLPNHAFEDACNGRKKPTFPDTEINRKIFQYYVDHNWISSYKKDHDSGLIRTYPKRK